MAVCARSTAVFALLAAAQLGACAETNAPLPEPVETLLVVNQGSGTLSVVPVDQPADAVQIPLGMPAGTPSGVAARDTIAVVVVDAQDAAVVVDLVANAVLRTVHFPTGAGAAGVAVVSDSLAYIANPGRNTVTRINLWTGDTAAVPIGNRPQGVAFVRGRVFVFNGNLAEEQTAIPVSGVQSWITVVDPATNARATGIDSIPLTGSGNAKFADIGADGLLYVVSTGRAQFQEGRLSIVDPVARAEIANFAGFGASPGNPASDGDERIFVSSMTEGLLEFDTRTRTVIHGAGNGIALPNNSAVAADSRGRTYAVDTDDCASGHDGLAHVLDALGTEVRTIPLGQCPVAATVVKVP